MLYELVKGVHIDIHQELRREISEWETFPWCGTSKALYHSLEKPHRVGVGNVSCENGEEHCMVNRGKELFNITFQYPAGACVVVAHFLRKRLETHECLMCTLPHTTGIRVSDERVVEECVEHSMDSVVQKSVAHRGFVDVAGFGVGNIEGVVATMRVCFVFKVCVKCENIIDEVVLK